MSTNAVVLGGKWVHKDDSARPSPEPFIAERPVREPQRLSLKFEVVDSQLGCRVEDKFKPSPDRTLFTTYRVRSGQVFRVSEGETWECEVASKPHECEIGWEVFVQPVKRLRAAHKTSAPISSLLAFSGVCKVVVVERVQAPVASRGVSMANIAMEPVFSAPGNRLPAETLEAMRTPPPVRGVAVAGSKKIKGGK